MSIIKRLTATVSAHIEQLVGQIENHDAVIGAAINDTRRAAARAKARLSRLSAERDRMAEQIRKLREDGEHWATRATDCAHTDRDKAIECMRRRSYCQQQEKLLTDAYARHDQVIVQLSSDLRTLDQRISDLTQQRNLLRTRQATAEAMHSVSQLTPTLDTHIGDTLERWEAQVMANEFATQNDAPDDLLEREFVSQEERAFLLAELDRLASQRSE